jgi:parallel beta-helix repeat protein
MVVVLLVSVLMLAFRVQPVEAVGPVIFIMSDGSIVPPTAPISTADKVTFTLTNNITYPTYYGVVAQRNNIVIDGVGYSLASNQSGVGLNVTSVNNVTIKNLKVLSFNIGILLNASSNDYVTGTSLDGNAAKGIDLANTLSSNITQNTLTNNWQPICLEFSHNNRVTDNSVTNNTFGIYTYSSTNNLVFRNNVTKSRGGSGIYVYSGGNNNLTGNRLADNLYAGVEMSTSSLNIMLGNNISNNTYGIKLSYGSNSASIVGNNVSSNWLGFRQDDSSSSFLRNNLINGNNYSFSVAGSQLSSFINDVNASNTIDGKPLIYLINQTNCAINPTTYPSIGYLVVVNSTSVTAENFSMNRSYEGALLAYTNNSFVKNVTVSNSQSGIVFAGSSWNNTVSSSTLVANNIGVLCSSNSTISNCNFTSNNQGVQLSSNNTIIVGNSMTNNSNYGVYGSSYSATRAGYYNSLTV